MATKKKPRARNPTPLDRFLPVDFQNLLYVVKHGKLTMTFDTPNQATNTKARLWRLRESLLHFEPDNELSKACKYFTFKINQNLVTIVNRVNSPEMRAQVAAMEAPITMTADPQEVDWGDLDKLELENGQGIESTD
jgi:hypothetical protein